MLDSLRSAVNSWPAKILLGLVLLSFVVWGGHSAFQSEGDDNLLSSGGSSVSAAVYDMSLRNEALRLSMNIGRYLTPDEMRRFGLPQAVFGQLYRNVLLDNAAAQMKLGVSDKGAAELLKRDPAFKDQSGNFDMSAFNFYVQNLRSGRDAFLDIFYKQAARRDQISSTVTGGADASDTFYKALALYTKQTRQADYVEIAPEPLSQIPDADETALTAWFKANNSAFRTPEYRQIDYIALTPQDINTGEPIDSAAIAAYYKAHQNSYVINPEKRSFTLARFADRQTADSAHKAMEAEIKAGKSAAAAFNSYFAQQSAVKPEKQTNISRAELPGLAGAEIFSLEKGVFSPVINELQGPVIALVEDIKPAQFEPLAEVSAQIKQDINREKAINALPDYRKKIEDSRYDGANLKDIAAQYHLSLRRIITDKNGQTPQGQKADFPQTETLLKNIFAAAANTDADPLNLQAGGYVWYNIDEIIPPRDSALNEVRAQAMAAWKQEQRQQRLDERAAELAKALNGGADFAALAKNNGLTLRQAQNLSRTATEKALSEQAVAAIFAAIKGESGVASGAQEQNRIVFRVNAITEPKNAGRALLSAAEQEAISQNIKTDLLGLYIGAQAQQTPVTVNKAVYNRLMQDQP